MSIEGLRVCLNGVVKYKRGKGICRGVGAMLAVISDIRVQWVMAHGNVGLGQIRRAIARRKDER